MKARSLYLALACLTAAACARVEMEPDNLSAPGFKRVTVDASVPGTRSVVADDGTFSWSAGDVISVLATDGNFYDFVLESGTTFAGTIPEAAEITTVAAYPSVAENGTNGGVYADGKLNFTLKGEIDALEGCSNIPMVASFAEGAERFDFKQVGAAFKFLVDGAPADFFAEVTFSGTNPTGTFAIDPTKVGSVALEGVASEVPVSVTAHYVSESTPVEGATFYIPVAVGSYTSMHVKLYEMVDGEPAVFYDEDRVRESGDYSVARGDIFIMKPIAVSIPMRITRVAPLFSDAKVTFVANVAATVGYAFYVDDAEPLIVEDPELTFFNVGAPYQPDGSIDNGTNAQAGTFAMGSTHTVAVAPVGAEGIITTLKSDAVSFTTGVIEQLTGPNTNQGPYQFTVWMKPANFPTTVPHAATKEEMSDFYAPTVAGEPANDDEHVFAIQLFASNDPASEPIYDLLTVDRQAAGSGAFKASDWMGKLNGTNLNIPDRITLGWLEPNTTYYFRARGIAPVDVSCPAYDNVHTVSTEAGESAWSELVPVTTGSHHVPDANEVLYQGFDDLMLGNDIVNSAAGLVPFLNAATKSEIDGGAGVPYFTPVVDAEDGHISWPSPSFASTEYPWTFNTFASSFAAQNWGLIPMPSEGVVFNEKAGTMKGWETNGSDQITPGYGNIRLGHSGSKEHGIVSPALDSPLLSNEPQSCTVTIRGCPTGKTFNKLGIGIRVDYLIPDGDDYRPVRGHELRFSSNLFPTVDKNNFFHDYAYQEISTMVKLAKGYKIRIVSLAENDNKRLLIDDIKVDLTPDVPYTGVSDLNGDDLPVSEADHTKYFDFGLGGDMPITYWFSPTKAFDNLETYRTVKDANFNIVLSDNHELYDADYNLKILGYCQQLDLKYIGKVDGGGWGQRIERQNECFAQIDQYINHPNYIGQYCGDEPNTDTFEGYNVWHNAFYNRYIADPSFEHYNPNAFIYVNLFPNYANVSQLGLPYEQYIDSWLSMNDNKPLLKTLSFDSYPLNSNPGYITPNYYLGLDLVRAKTLAKRIHFWMIGQSGVISSKKPFEIQEPEFRWNAWTAIALGSKGYQYFCYWTPSPDPDDKWVDDQFMVNSDTGEPTPRYYFGQRLNYDIQHFKALMHCHADGAIMNPLSEYALYQPRSKYSKLMSVSGDRSVVGCFRDVDDAAAFKAVVTHLEPSRDGVVDGFTVTLTFDSSISTVTTTYSKDGTVATVPVTDGKVTLTFDEGEAYLVEWSE